MMKKKQTHDALTNHCILYFKILNNLSLSEEQLAECIVEWTEELRDILREKINE